MAKIAKVVLPCAKQMEFVLTVEPRWAGGKVKPLKAAKKEKKELDEEDKAFLEKKKSGTLPEEQCRREERRGEKGGEVRR